MKRNRRYTRFAERLQIARVLSTLFLVIRLDDILNRHEAQNRIRAAYMILVEVGNNQVINRIDSLLMQRLHNDVAILVITGINQNRVMRGFKDDCIRLAYIQNSDFQRSVICFR